MAVHILPVNDLEKHEETTTCKCNPTIEILENGEMMIIHNNLKTLPSIISHLTCTRG